MKPKSKLAVFDIDGTLVDSRATIARAMAQAFVAAGLPAPGYDKVRAVVGLSLDRALGALSGVQTPQVSARLRAAYVESFVTQRAAHGAEPLYDGAEALLASLKSRGWKIGVATGKSHAGLKRLMESHRLDAYFDALFCADDGPGKPDPHMLVCNMRALGADAADTIMIGDTSHDMEMARAAGAYPQGVSWGFHTRSEVLASGALHVADDFAQLEAALEAFAAPVAERA